VPKIISIAIPKGGVGKTSTAVNLAASLAALEKRTLLIDIDPAGSCSVALNVQPENTKGGSFDLISYTHSIDQVIHKTSLEGLDFIPSNVSSYEDEEKINRLTTNILLLRNILEQQILSYDYIIIDCPPYLAGMTNLGLAASNSVIIPVRSANFSIKALQKMVHHIGWLRKNYNSHLKIEGILHTMFEARTKASIITESKLHEIIGKYVFKTKIPKTTAIGESTYYGKPIVLFNASSVGANAYIQLASEITVRAKECPVIEMVKQANLKLLTAEKVEQNSLLQNYPNPFSKSTSIAFTLTSTNPVKIDIFELNQAKVCTLIDTRLDSGKYEYTWIPNGLRSGVYIYRIRIGEYEESRKLIYSTEKH
jgi:chromosome partitioning protein